MFDLPSDVSKSAITALMSSLELGSPFAAAGDELVAAASLTVPHKPLGSATETATPATMMLSNTWVHSSGVKSLLLAMAVSSGSESPRWLSPLLKRAAYAEGEH